MAANHDNKHKTLSEFYMTDEDGYEVIQSDDFIFRKPPMDRIVAYVRCLKCHTKLGVTDWDDPDEIITTHC